MQVRTVRRSIGVISAGTLLIAALALPGSALADTTGGPTIPPAASRDATISIQSARIVAKVIVRVDVDYVCQPFESYDWDTGETYETTLGSVEQGQVVVVQAQGRTVATGAGFISAFVTCDGTTVNHLTADVIASASPWRNGSAVIGAAVFAADAASFNDGDYASTGAIATRLASR